jgi:hypothetical protein
MGITDLWARGERRWRRARSSGSTSRQAAVAHSPARCGNVLAVLLAEQRAVSAFPLGSAARRGGLVTNLVTNLAPAIAATDELFYQGRHRSRMPIAALVDVPRIPIFFSRSNAASKRVARKTPGRSGRLR